MHFSLSPLPLSRITPSLLLAVSSGAPEKNEKLLLIETLQMLSLSLRAIIRVVSRNRFLTVPALWLNIKSFKFQNVKYVLKQEAAVCLVK